MSATKAWVLERFCEGGIDKNFAQHGSRFRQARIAANNVLHGRDPHYRPDRWVVCREGRPGWWADQDFEGEPRRRDRMHFEDAMQAIVAYKKVKTNTHTVRMRNLQTMDIIMGDILVTEPHIDAITGTTMFK